MLVSSIVTTARAMIPLAQMKWVSPQTRIVEALTGMDRDGVSQVPVMEADDIAGMLSREDVISYLRVLQELRA